jgi:hypothetical protein
MRVSRVEKFKKSRRRKARRLLFYGIVIPFTSVLLGYLITSIIILPAMAK